MRGRLEDATTTHTALAATVATGRDGGVDGSRVISNPIAPRAEVSHIAKDSIASPGERSQTLI